MVNKDKYQLREVLVTHGGFTPNCLEALTKHLDELLEKNSK
jgi:hypothetical protein